LAAATVGVAMGGDTEVAIETADTALLNSRVTDIAALVGLSRATLADIHQNVAVALWLKVIFVVTTLARVTGLWPVVLANTGATVLVTLNALWPAPLAAGAFAVRPATVTRTADVRNIIVLVVFVLLDYRPSRAE
jgi:cation transport ATPase